MYDIIGDTHGYADELFQLLEAMGYRRVGGVYEHPQRQAIFVGDFVDRGPQIRELLEMVRGMCEAGTAQTVMGNHEFNALAFHTLHPDDADQYLRPRTDKNLRQHAATLAQLTPEELMSYLEWFRTLPMWLDLGGIRVVHACWDQALQDQIDAALTRHGGVTARFLAEASDRNTELFHAVDDVLKGKEVMLPAGHVSIDKEGNQRRSLRVRWYERSAGKTFASYAMIAEPSLPEQPLPEQVHTRNRPYEEDAPPVIFGHYWLREDAPRPLRHNVACVDYSVAKEGSLCAYRWQGESELTDEHFVTVPARSNPLAH